METGSTDDRPAKRLKMSPEPQPSAISLDGPSDHLGPPSVNSRAPVSVSDMTPEAKELEVGINTFMDENRPVFHGLLKKRYTDFLVNEILPNGKVLHLLKTRVEKQPRRDGQGQNGDLSCVNGAVTGEEKMDLEKPEAAKPSTEKKVTEMRLEESEKKTDEVRVVSDVDKARLVEYFNEAVVEKLIDLFNSILENPRKKSREHLTVKTEFTSDRSIRTQIHQDIRRIFSHKIESSTNHDGLLILSAAAPSNRKDSRAPGGNKGNQTRPGRLGWMDRGGEHLHFTLYKENKDTMEVISYLTRSLKTNAKVFQFAGTKDRRAVTAQRVSAFRVEAERLAAQNRSLYHAAVGDFEYHKHGLELGDLGGNEFVITLRDCSLADTPSSNIIEKATQIRATVTRALSSLHTHGFLNYFGLQRFGTFATRTDVIGLKLLKGDFEGACNSILDFNPASLTEEDEDPSHTNVKIGSDDRARARAIHLFTTTRSAHNALAILPRKFSAESALIRHLSSHPSDFLGALLMIQRNLRLMYAHAYQSLVWNLAVGHRYALYGGRAVEGDLVLVKEHEQQKDAENGDGEEEVDVDGEAIVHAAPSDRAASADDVFERARALSASEAARGEYSIFDVVLPLPGYDVLYPGNASGNFYNEFMGSERGGGLDPDDMRRKQRDFSLSGSYRKVVGRIGPGWGVEVHTYAGDAERETQFVTTDLERLEASRAQKVVVPAGGEEDADPVHEAEISVPAKAAVEEDGNGNQPAPPNSDKGKDQVAAILKFQLGSSQYATMALRELSRGGITAYKADFGGGR